MTRPANVNFAKLVKLAMRNGFANFAKWFANFAMRNFAKVETNEQCIGIAKLKLALRNSHCEFGIAKFSHCEIGLRTHCEFWQCEISLRFCERQISQGYSVLGLLDFAMRNWLPTHCEIRNGCELFANSLRKSCFAVFPCFSSCLQLHLILSTFPLFFH